MSELENLVIQNPGSLAYGARVRDTGIVVQFERHGHITTMAVNLGGRYYNGVFSAGDNTATLNEIRDHDTPIFML